MNMTLLYLLSIRLATLFTGAMSLYLGYRLLIQEQHPVDNKNSEDNKSEVEARVGIAAIKLKNVSAGVIFTAFGAFLVIAPHIANPPQVETISSNITSQGSGKATHTKTVKIIARGDERQNNKQIAESLHQQAAILFKNKQIKAAYEIEKSVVHLQPKNDLYMETVAGYAFNNKDCVKAIKYMQKALTLQEQNSYFKDLLIKYQQACQ